MEIRDLRYFIASVEAGHLHRAAEQVGRSQPALSKAIKRLEQEFGGKLFQRDGRGLRPTTAGLMLLDHARRLSNGLDDAKRQLSEAAKGSAGHVRIGAGPTTAACLLPGIFGEILAELPGLTYEVRVGLGEALRGALREGRVDLLIVPLIPTDRAEFSETVLGPDIMVVAVRKGHPLGRGTLRPEQLRHLRWLLPAGSVASTLWLQRAFAAHGLPAPSVKIEVTAVTLLRSVVARTDLATFISRRELLEGGGAPLDEINVPDLEMHRHLGVLSPKRGYKLEAAERFVGTIKAWSMDHLY